MVGAIAYIENLLPPFPSDVAIVAAASLVAFGSVNIAPLIIAATLGSTLGFLTMYRIGHWFGDRVLETGRIRFISVDQVHKVETWFRTYGYGVIVANRFLAGTRAVISFFAGMSNLSLWKTTVLSLFSALAWNSILVYAGKTLGTNWSSIAFYLETYSKAITTLLLVLAFLFAMRYFLKKKDHVKPPDPPREGI
jgi:membrane protein DedA with SNARE-associated domain